MFAEDVQHTPDYEFVHQFPFEDITTIELWDDIEFVDEISFKYKNDDDGMLSKSLNRFYL